MAKVRNRWLAVRMGGPGGRSDPCQAWDMLRYDTCYPSHEANLPENWFLVRQDYRQGYNSRFTIARWESFGYRHFVEGIGEVLPHDFSDAVRQMELAAQAGVKDQHRLVGQR